MGHDKNPPPPPTKKNDTPKPTKGVEGEGSYEATHRYNEGLSKSIERGDGEKLAKKAAKALDGTEGDELLEAAEKAKKGQS